MIAFGLDLAGYSTGKSGFARARWDGDADLQVVVYQDHPLAQKYAGVAPLADIVAKERSLLAACLTAGALYVDIPIDLQGLPSPENPFFAWELTRRPIDFAFQAMPALADRIGAPMARFRHLLAGLDNATVGENVFETYPALSLRNLGLTARGYKNQHARYHEGEWQGGYLAELLNALGFEADDGSVIDDDAFDAMICALTGVVGLDHCLAGSALEAETAALLRARTPLKEHAHIRIAVPVGYAVLKSLP
ncbi:MAG: DUF429 domain-containing protein [Chloroflexi bacterium]|nr:DUF429 domain-containing protein [Chloroflexota bacterium]